MTAHWWAAYPAAEAELPCGGVVHRLRWEGGALTLPDHPDTEAELILGLLGGEKPACVRLLEHWNAHAEDLEVLALAPRGPRDTLDPLLDPEVPPGPRVWPPLFTSSLHHPPGGEEKALERRRELLALFSLGTAFQIRLAATVAAAWSAHGPRAAERAAARPRLTAALAGRVAPCVEDWTGVEPDRVEVELHEGEGWGRTEVARTEAGVRIRVRLPEDWLARVWGAGLAVVGGRLVVQVLAADGGKARVLGVAGPGAEPEEYEVVYAEPEWRRAQAEGADGARVTDEGDLA